ncbi:HSP20-like chaperones superfamily protein [Perilla frutescens var. hirtella]|nr:HSP20-like chaperones superfamily protein [Perilla frutescens var. frutescens]KAH6786657.1 HSP20-like chaperones superfamily protein [Perilla frutescens var. hirtella]
MIHSSSGRSLGLGYIPIKLSTFACMRTSNLLASTIIMNGMDSSNPGKVKKIIWKRSKSPVDVNDGIMDPDKCEDAGEEMRHCDSRQLVTYPRTCNSTQPFALPLLPVPKMEEWCSNTSIALTGTACRGGTGPPVGAVDIGESKSAYYFCIALPGVKKDPGEFSCEIQRDGKVCVRGVTSTGGKFVQKYSRVYEMKLQQQCQPGPFTLFFNLPGPVDPRLFAPHFRPDGIFEAVVAKYE